MSAGDVMVVLVTAPSVAVGERIAETVVGERLAASVNIVPAVRSVFRWAGRVEQRDESLLVIKTSRDRLDPLQTRVCALHPYSVPSFIALPIEGGHEPYLQWVSECVTAEGGDEPDQE